MPAPPPLPPERHETIRQRLTELLGMPGRPLSARELSALASVTEKEVYAHLEHIRKTLDGTQRALRVEPAVCRQCGFEFSKRTRLKRPARCPACKGESIEGPGFSIE